ncbi:site-specific DNA-methyltransferase [Pseudoxanthomonas beigongshangi]|uniref:site-specific DNA-methyltransferase n=1 Tax=Pseudoxanthomonas beigongshangi TaxID=2782537 RepID=UPI002E27C1E7|nr:DNA methyltransferase [Pseudoxanthomonas beigongshangi]
MSRISDLIAQAKAKEPVLGADLEREFKALSSRLPFGLNFERHSPEAVELPQRPVRKGDKVRILPPRGSTKKGDQRLWQVTSIDRTKKAAELALLSSGGSEKRSAMLDDLVVVAEFRDTIYPGLVSTGKVQRGGDKSHHTVINGENYHVLKALTYTHRGKVDAIYIDPPYNTGARDWKYNNDYVESDDLYRHSKWLAMMERRILVAKELLNPDDSVLIVAIDENEVHRLGLLLEQLLPEARIQVVTVVINPSGASGDGFSRVEEYLLFARLGESTPERVEDNLLTDMDAKDGRVKGGLSWESFLRSGVGNTRSARPNLCYPILIDDARQAIVGAGEPLVGPDDSRATEIDGYPVAWPVRNDGTLGMWRRDRDGLMALVEKGYAFISGRDLERNTWSLKYLLSGTISAIESGKLEVERTGDKGQVQAVEEARKLRVGKTVWNRQSHNAGKHGSDLLRTLLPNRQFPFPKSLYAVEDALRFFVKSKPNAIVLDFFSGSGTTAHAVMRLNRQDGGRRQCISVTNNEVGAEEQKSLRARGLRPGDQDWEMLGICDHITKPRIRAAIEGRTPNGDPIKGEYKFTDAFPISEGFEENAEFFTLSYETPVSVSYNMAFTRIAPLLWLRAGAEGKRIDKLPTSGWDVADTYGLLVDIDAATQFVKAVKKNTGVRLAYIVTDDDRRFQAIASRMPEAVEPVRLYESYLTNFSFANGD